MKIPSRLRPENSSSTPCFAECRPGSAGVPPAFVHVHAFAPQNSPTAKSDELRQGTRRRDASAPRAAVGLHPALCLCLTLLVPLVSTLHAAPTISSVVVNPATPGNFDNVTISALVAPSSGTTISQAKLQYGVGAVTTSNVFRETLPVTFNNGWTGTGAQNPWTVTANRAGGDVRLRAGAANHTVPVVLTNCVTNGTTTVTCDSTAAAWPGMIITGTNIAAGTTISAIPSATTLTLSVAATGSGSALSLTAAGVTLTNCSTTSGSATVTCASTVGLVVGMGVNATTAQPNPTVSSITDGTTFVLNSNASASANGLTLTASGCGVEMSVGTATYTDTMFTTSTSLNASAASSGYVEFYARTTSLISGNGYTFQISPDGGTTWNTRVSETYAGSTVTLTGCTLNATNTVTCASTSGLANGMVVQAPTVRINNSTTGNGSPTVTCPDTTGLAVGMFISGNGIPANAHVLSFVTNTSYTLSANATASATVSVLANYFNGNVNITSVTNGTTFAVSGPPFYSGSLASIDATTINHGFTLKHYNLVPADMTSGMRMRFQFSGYANVNPAPAPACDIDDILVSLTIGTAPVTLTMFDDGAHGDGAAADGVYAATIPAQTGGTTVSWSITATDSATNTATTSSTYNVITVAPVLSITPTTALSTAGPVGGPFSPSSASYTLSNTGTGSLNWTASKTASWLTLSSASGTLTVGATTTVTASINAAAASLSAGNYADIITFTNATNGTGNSLRSVSLSVQTTPSAPVFNTVPAYSRGSSSTLSWPAVAGATSYTVQASLTSDFANASTQTVTTASATFINLINGTTYYYRVLATNSAGSSAYSSVASSVQDTSSPTIAITSPASALSTATASITVSGTSSDTISGVATVKVNNVAATTTNGYATWTATVPLGFGTNNITATATDSSGNFTTTLPVVVTLTSTPTYNPLYIPDTMTGTTFNLTLDQSSRQFYSGPATQTYGYNHAQFWGPTLIMKKGDFVQVNLTNNIGATTTTHWHGFHIPAIMDGGPHEVIANGAVWSPSFYIKNNAGLYWYHPHLHPTTEQQLALGAGGLIIIQDPVEAALPLPRTYGTDDIPIVLTSRRFTFGGAGNNQIFTQGSFGDVMLVNGTMNPQVNLPAQVVRLRILDGEFVRNHNLGFSDNRTFWVISSDGGLLNAPVPVTRLVMGVAERYEILVDLSHDAPGTSLNLVTYNSTYANTNYPGGQLGTTGANGSLLNAIDFNDLNINVVAATANPITTIPTTLASNTYWTTADVTNNRTVTITGVGGNPLAFDNVVYSPSYINQTINFNAVEQWTLVNASNLAHTFHIHDIQFYLTNVQLAPPYTQIVTQGNVPAYQQGWKDTFMIMPQSSVTFITKFDDFASNTNPFMFHCHMLPHEDGGLMGQFLVQNNQVEDLAIASFTRVGSDPAIHMQFKATVGTTYTVQYSPDMTTTNWTDIGSITSNGTSGDFYETDPTRLASSRGFYRVTMPLVTQ